MKRFLLIALLSLTLLTGQSQSCDTGQLDARVKANLNDSIHDLQPRLNTLSIEQVKQDAMNPLQSYPAEDVKVTRITNDSIPVFIFNASKGTNLPVILYFHPGGFVTPFLPFMKYECWKMSKEYNAIVFAVDYHIAPDYKFPAAVDDAYHSFEWILKHGATWGGDMDHLVVAGLSAGGNLAAVVCQKAKLNGLASRIKLQVLNCPPLDNIRHQSRYPSYTKYSKGYFQTTSFITFAQHTYGSEKVFDDPEFAPLLRKDLRGLPPTVMITAEFDILRDEEMLYEKRLREAGVKVWALCFPGQIHCLIGLPADATEFVAMNRLIKSAMNEAFSK